MADTGTLSLRNATTAEDLAAVQGFCWDYWKFLLNNSDRDRRITEAFYPRAKYAALMDRLSVEHARPDGMIMLALLDETPVGCGMIHALDAQTSEIKRVFVAGTARGHGVAEKLCTALMDQARADGFSRMVLDTSKSLTAAQRLYTRLGFHPRGPYQDVPEHVLEHLLFYEITL